MVGLRSAGLVFWHKQDKMGRPCIVCRPRYHVPKETTLEATYQACVYFMETARRKYFLPLLPDDDEREHGC